MVDPNAPVTNKTLDEAVDTILQGMDKLITNFREEVRVGFKKTELRFDRVEAEISGVKDDINGLTAELSDTVSRKEFTRLQTKVDKYLVA